MGYTPTIWKKGDIITAQKLNKMENAMHAILSDYTQTIWADGGIISVEKLNKLENAIEYVNLDYIKTVWENNDIVTASLLNKMENGIEMASVKKTWEEMSWNDIIAATRTGRYQGFNVGDMKELHLGTEGVINMQIVGIDVDDLSDGSGKAPLTFISHELLETSHRMNPSLSTDSSAPYPEGAGSIGGWEKSEMRAYIKENIKMLIPTNVRVAIKEVTKYSTIRDTSGEKISDNATNDDVWIPSSHEIVTDSTNYETLGPVYSDVFTGAASRIKCDVETDYANQWWLRSANTIYRFTCINDAGGHYTRTSGTNDKIALGFCL